MDYPLWPGKDVCVAWKKRGSCSGWERHKRCGFDHPAAEKGTAGGSLGAELASGPQQLRKRQRQEPRERAREFAAAKTAKESLEQLTEAQKAAERTARHAERAARHAEEAELEEMMAEIRLKKEAERELSQSCLQDGTEAPLGADGSPGQWEELSLREAAWVWVDRRR